MADQKMRKQGGKFVVGGRSVYGELTINGEDTLLWLRDDDDLDTRNLDSIHGTLHDLTKVSLLQCISPGPGNGNRNGETYYFAEVFPHYVVSGTSHIAAEDETISSINFLMRDAHTFFYDFDAFGMVLNAADHIDVIANANRATTGREVQTGPDAKIMYFAGLRQIFSADTMIGTVGAAHSPTYNWPSPRGVSIPNSIPVTIEFPTPQKFETALDQLYRLRRFLELLIGREQHLLDIHLGLRSDRALNVDVSLPVQHKANREDSAQSPADALIDPIRDQAAFCEVLRAYLDRPLDWEPARMRFSSMFNMGYDYDIDRLVASANLFDLLPDDAFPPIPPISNDLVKARDDARALFKNLPPSDERAEILLTLKRMGRLTLNRRIGVRVALIVARSGERFPELPLVARAAVKCRNFYVHGGEPDFDYAAHDGLTSFFVDTLLFVFGASDLIDAGWSFEAWLAKNVSGSHPFGNFKVHYKEKLATLKRVLEDAKPEE